MTNISSSVRTFTLVGFYTDPEPPDPEPQPTENIEAYEYYLRGRRHFYQFSEQGWKQAREALSRAIELDPDDAVNFVQHRLRVFQYR